MLHLFLVRKKKVKTKIDIKVTPVISFQGITQKVITTGLKGVLDMP